MEWKRTKVKVKEHFVQTEITANPSIINDIIHYKNHPCWAFWPMSISGEDTACQWNLLNKHRPLYVFVYFNGYMSVLKYQKINHHHVRIWGSLVGYNDVHWVECKAVK